MARKTTKRAERLASDLRHVLGGLKRRVRSEAGGDELSMAEHAVLKRLIHDGPATTATLARAEWVRPQSMGATLAQLESEGLVARAPDASDGRCLVVSITEEGRSMFLAGLAARESWLARRLDDLSPDEQRQLRDAIEVLRRIVES
ncbi:MAG: MarR family winged helix-turn-helix transcriptional regulator [Sandaracinaceae bacterium]